VASKVRAAVASQLFDGGYLDGIPGRVRDGKEDLDDWARDALGLTPLLDAAQLARFEGLASPRHATIDAADGLTFDGKGKYEIGSGTLRGWFYAGIAVGYANCGRPDDTYRVLAMAHVQDTDELRYGVLAEIMYRIGADDLPEWIAQVHRFFRTALQRSRLWAHLSSRMDELSDEQMWEILDRWLVELARGSRADVLADALLYRDAVARLAGDGECTRLMNLIEHREARAALTTAMPSCTAPPP
jgi:hypothetical protein